MAMVCSSCNTLLAKVTLVGSVMTVSAGIAAISLASEHNSGSSAITFAASAPLLSGAPCAPTGSGVCRYVDPAGNDANPGTSSQPFRTLQAAAGVVKPGDVVIVRNGTYTGGSTILDIGASGTAANPIVFKAENKWGAVIDGQNNSSDVGIEVNGSYIRVQGFEIRGTAHYGIEAYLGSNVPVSPERVHSVA